MDLVASFNLLDDEDNSYDIIEIYSTGVVLIKSAAGVIRTRFNPTTPHEGHAAKTSSKIEEEVNDIMGQFSIPEDDHVSRRLLRQWCSMKTGAHAAGMAFLARHSADALDVVTIEQWGAHQIKISGGEFEGHWTNHVEQTEDSKARIRKILDL